MSYVLTSASKVECPHLATVSTIGSPTLTVQGHGVLTVGSVSQWSIASCSWKPPPATKIPCTKVVSETKVAIKLTVGGNAVVLDTSVGTTNGSVPTPMSAAAGQTKLTAV